MELNSELPTILLGAGSGLVAEDRISRRSWGQTQGFSVLQIK